jgi:nicotinate-nucleotide adenylyltransferase
MNIAILGGSFDPPHKGHTTIAKRLLKLRHFSQIWLMPCYKHPFNKNLSSSNKRLEMTKYLEKNSIMVSDYEIKNKTSSYAIDTLRFFANKYPKSKFTFIIGTDQIKDFTKWKKWQEIIDSFKLIVIPRTGFRKAKNELEDIKKQVSSPKNIILIDKKKFLPIYVSSTLIRKRAKMDKTISNFVPKEIEKYIIENKLYR